MEANNDDAIANELAGETITELRATLRKSLQEKLEIKTVLDNVAIALHPHKGDVVGWTYTPTDLPDMVRQLHTNLAMHRENELTLLATLRTTNDELMRLAGEVNRLEELVRAKDAGMLALAALNKGLLAKIKQMELEVKGVS